jgi:hypothetical protein
MKSSHVGMYLIVDPGNDCLHSTHRVVMVDVGEARALRIASYWKPSLTTVELYCCPAFM